MAERDAVRVALADQLGKKRPARPARGLFKVVLGLRHICGGVIASQTISRGELRDELLIFIRRHAAQPVIEVGHGELEFEARGQLSQHLE